MTNLATLRRAASGALLMIVLAGMSATPSAQTAPPAAPQTIVVIGCVTQLPAGERGDEGAHSSLVITDTRSKPPRKFVLQGAMESLAWHVGHTLEIHGRVLSEASKGPTAPSAQLPILDVRSVIYLEPTCAAPPA